MDKKQMEMLSVKSAIERTIQGYISTYTTLSGNNSKEFFQAVERSVAAFFVSGQIDNNYLVRSINSGDIEIRFSTHGHYTCLTMFLPDPLKWRFEIRESALPKIDNTKAPTKNLYNPMQTMQMNETYGYTGKFDHESMTKESPAESTYNPLEMNEEFGHAWGRKPGSKIEELPATGGDVIITGGNTAGTGTGGPFTFGPSEKKAHEPVDKFLTEEGAMCYDAIKEELLTYNRVKGWTSVPEDVFLEGMVRRGKTGHLEVYKNGEWIALPQKSGTSIDPALSNSAKEETPEDAYERAKKAVETMK